MMVQRAVILRCQVALRAQLVALKPDTGGMRIVAVRAADAFAIHQALRKRTEHIHFFINLSVVVIQMIFQNRKSVVVIETVSRLEAGMNALPMGMARSAGLQLGRLVLAVQICEPMSVSTIPEKRLGIGQLNMDAAGAVTGLTTHVHFRPGGMVGI